VKSSKKNKRKEDKLVVSTVLILFFYSLLFDWLELLIMSMLQDACPNYYTNKE